MQPIIAVGCGHQWKHPERYYVNAGYVNGILRAGGIPVLLPAMDEPRLTDIFSQVGGLLLPGGIDIDARLFSEEPHPGSGEINPVWDQADLALIKLARERELPILAICRGIQILNIGCGGGLIQDIPAQITNPIKHMQQAPYYHPTHNVRIEPDSILENLFSGKPLAVNSFHHQAVGKVASGFRASAYSSDGVIEAIESTTHPYQVGVQWHPELMTNHYPVFQKLFDQLIKQATAQ